MEETIGKTFEGSVDKFAQKLDNVRERVDALQQEVDEPSLKARGMTPEVLEELHSALEELNVAQEELKVQNEELTLVRAKMEAERKRYLDLFEFAPDGYLVTDQVGVILEANRAAVRLLNVSPQFLIRKPLINFIPFEQRRTFRCKLNQLQKADWAQEWEVKICPRDRVSFDAAMTVSTVRDWEGRQTGWRWLLRDITTRKQAEEKLRNTQLQNVQLQEVARLKSHFLAIMSHELRSPMNAIIGFSQLLLRYSDHPLASKQQNMVERILNSGKHLLTLIDEILDFSKLEAGKMELKQEELNLVELVTAISEEMRSLVEQKNLTMHVNLNLHNPTIVNDSNRLRQILINLISNAIKFTDSGSVLVDACELTADRIAIAVKDTGIGIAESDLAHIFNEFRQVNQTITRKHGGTGLGLAITNRLVGMMQGKITVESQLEQGSTFCVELPRRAGGVGGAGGVV